MELMILQISSDIDGTLALWSFIADAEKIHGVPLIPKYRNFQQYLLKKFLT